MPVDVKHENAKLSVVTDMTDEVIDQIWAEAYQLYLADEPLYLNSNESMLARIEQAKHAESDERKGIIDEFLDKLYPDNWVDMDIFERRNWLEDPIRKKGTVQRKYVCVAEIWCECLGKDKADMSRYNTRDINETLKSLADWEAVSSTKNFPLYGKQKYYKRKESLL